MNSQHQLGGARQASPLDDEMSYPLTNDEFLIIKENLSFDKFSNWESFLLATGISMTISWAVTYFSGTFLVAKIEEGLTVTKANMPYIITLIIYGMVGLGAFLGLATSIKNKIKLKKPMQRLEEKITNHLTKYNS